MTLTNKVQPDGAGLTPAAPETETTTTPQSENVATPAADDLVAQIARDPQGMAAYIRRLREENAARRKASDRLEELTAEAEKRERAQAAAAEAALAEQGQFKTLAEKRAAEITALQAQTEALKPYQAALQGMLDARLNALSEDQRRRVPDFGDAIKTLTWLDANQDLFAARVAPVLNPGAVSGTPDQQTDMRERIKQAKPNFRL